MKTYNILSGYIRFKRQFPLAMLAVCLIAGSGCQSKKTEPAAATTAASDSTPLLRLTPAQLANAGIRTDSVAYRSVPSHLNASGKTENLPGERASVSAVYGGYVEQIAVLPGQQVSQGQMLAVLSDPQYVQLGQDYLAASARLQLAEKEQQRLQLLQSQEAASLRELEAAGSQVETERINRAAAAEKLRLAGIAPEKLTSAALSRRVTLSAPIAGTVTAVNTNLGKRSAAAEVLFEITSRSQPRVILEVFEKDLARLNEGQSVTCWQPDAPDRIYKGRIEAVIRSIGAARTAQVRCLLDVAAPALPEGAFMQARIATGSTEGSMLSDKAIVRNAGKTWVFAEVEQGSYRLLPVRVLHSADGFSVLEGRLPRKLYVTEGAYTLLMTLKNTEE
jgi:cobalt-zinc-cadmium efflux system membrane fusion protein